MRYGYEDSDYDDDVGGADLWWVAFIAGLLFGMILVVCLIASGFLK